MILWGMVGGGGAIANLGGTMGGGGVAKVDRGQGRRGRWWEGAGWVPLRDMNQRQQQHDRAGQMQDNSSGYCGHI